MSETEAKSPLPDPKPGSGSGWSIPCRALVVARNNESCGALRDLLSERAVSSYTSDPESVDAFALLDRDARISILVVRANELSSTNLDELLKITFERPGLRTFVQGARGSAADRLGERGAILVSLRENTGAFVETIVGSLDHHFFDEPVLEGICKSFVAALADTSFSVDALPPIVRVGSFALAELSAVISFAGDRISGRMVVSGGAAFWQRVSREWLGRNPTTKEWIWDAAGELCNRVVGRVRQHYHLRGLPSVQSTPMIVDGPRVAIRSTPVSPGLVVPFQCSKITDPVYVELVLTSKKPDCATHNGPDVMMVGELAFL